MDKILFYLGTRQALLYLRSKQITLMFFILAALFFPQSTLAIACPAGQSPVCPPAGEPAFTISEGTNCRKPRTTEVKEPSECREGAPAQAPTQPTLPQLPGINAPGFNLPGQAPPPPTLDCSKPENKGKCSTSRGISCGPSTGSKDFSGGMETAIGCIPSEPRELVSGLLKYGTAAAGAIAFIIMLLGALQMITAEGNPELIKASQERFYSAIIGLLFIIFSVLLMQVIGVDILNLPGFSR